MNRIPSNFICTKCGYAHGCLVGCPTPVAENKGEACPCGGVLKYKVVGSVHRVDCESCKGAAAGITLADALDVVRRMYAASEPSPVPNARRLGDEELIRVGDIPVNRDGKSTGAFKADHIAWIGVPARCWGKDSVYRPNPLPATPATEDGLIEGLRNVGRYYGHYMNAAIRENTNAAISRIQSDAAKIKEQGETISTQVRVIASQESAFSKVARERDDERKWRVFYEQQSARNACVWERVETYPATCRTKNLYHASDFYVAGKIGAI